jgi:beta-1,4-mannosyl-glycoprotein beta-1,4-N-acetylglucosaminyltransferase
MFFNEYDVLEIRLNTLYDYVDRFILIECDRTHSGNSKPLFFKENIERFSDFKDKIIGVVYKYNDRIGSWGNENAQRDYAIEIIRDIHHSKDDIILLSDVDEIVSPSVIQRYTNHDIRSPWHCSQTLYMYFLNVRRKKDGEQNWDLPVIMRYSNITTSLTEIRLRKPYHGILYHGGWHFSYIGGIEQIKYKIQSFAHKELNKKRFLKRIYKRRSSLKDLFGRKYEIVPIDETFPNYVRNNIDRYLDRGLVFPYQNDSL